MNLALTTSRPLVAVVTPVYNGGPFLAGAMDAVQAQTYRPLVHVVLDNASTDNTAEIIARYANRDVPVIAHRNAATVPQADNANAVVAYTPPEARYFKLLCADDGMSPNAIELMMDVASSARDVLVVGGIERVNGRPRPTRLPPEMKIFEANNAIARILCDDARPPFPHVMFRTDVLRQGEPFYDKQYVAIDVDALLRVLSRGGRFGFVHEPIFDSLHHKGSVTQTVGVRTMSIMWELLQFIEQYGRRAMSETEFLRLRRRHRRSFYRRLLWWRTFGRSQLFQRDMARLTESGAAPNLTDYVDAVVAWPSHLYAKHISRSFLQPSEDMVEQVTNAGFDLPTAETPGSSGSFPAQSDAS